MPLFGVLQELLSLNSTLASHAAQSSPWLPSRPDGVSQSRRVFVNCSGDNDNAPLIERCNCEKYVQRKQQDPNPQVWTDFCNECNTVGVELKKS